MVREPYQRPFAWIDQFDAVVPRCSPARSTSGSVTEIQKYLEAGIDGFFTDDPAVGRQAVDTFKR